MISSDQKQDMPQFFNFLTKSDQKKYWDIKKKILNLNKKYKKNKKLELLEDSINLIHKYCTRNDSNDWKRYLVCGICWIENNIAINNRQLRFLINKCKSSINNGFLLMGYNPILQKSSLTNTLLEYIPFLKENCYEQRQWSIRTKIQLSPLPLIQENLLSPYNISYQTPQPTTPSFNWNSNDVDIQKFPDKLYEREIQTVFGLQNYVHKTQKDKKNNGEKVIRIDNVKQEISNQNPMFSDNITFNMELEESNQKSVNNFLELNDGNEEEQKKKGLFCITYYLHDSEFNFLVDPCCCCPIDWESSEKSNENFLSIE